MSRGWRAAGAARRERSGALRGRLMTPDTPTQNFIDAIRGGLDHSPDQVLLWVFVIGLVILIPLALSVFFIVRARQRRLRAAQRRFHEILMQRGLSEAEQALMLRLEHYFQHDKSRLPELAHDPALFNAASRAMREAEPEAEEAIARLRYKLKLIFKNAFQAPHSTTELTPGMAVYLTVNGRTEYNAMISDVQDSGFFIRTGLPAHAGDTAAFELHSRAGVFRWKSRIREIENGFCVFAHSEDIVQIQTRRYYRKHLHLPVTIVRPKAKTSAETYALDLSGGGAKLHDPGLNFEDNEVMTIVIYFSRTERAAIQARLVRLDRKESTLSLAFEHVSDAIRDKVVKLAR
jgi:hypothetical protein